MILETNDVFEVDRFVGGMLQTNCYVFSEKRSKKAIIIDPGTYDTAISGFIREKDLQVEYIVNTHGHADHLGGDIPFGFPVLIHELDGPFLEDPAKNLSFFAGGALKKIKPVRLLKDGDKILLDETQLEVIHTPGHTPGGISILYDNVLFSGDTLFCEGIGRTDCPGGDYDTIIASIRDRLMVLDDNVKVFPGHGPETTIGYERKNNPFI